MGPADELHDDETGPDDAAQPTRPSERAAWRDHGHDTTDDSVDCGVSKLPLS